MGIAGTLTSTTTRRVLLAATGITGVAVLLDDPRDFLHHITSLPKYLKRAIEDPHQAMFVIRHANHPWLASLGYSLLDEARAGEQRHFGSAGAIDNEADAFRHAYASGLFVLRAMRDHGISASEAEHLSNEAGRAHEADGADNDAGRLSSKMDIANNAVGASLIGDGHRGGLWMTERDVERAAEDALAHGKLFEIDADRTSLTAAS